MNHDLYLRLWRLVDIMESKDYHCKSVKYAELKKQRDEMMNEINSYLEITKDKDEIEAIIKSDPQILYLLPVDFVFDLFHKVFAFGSLDKDVIIAFAYFIHAYGPDWDEESEKIEKYVAENKLKEAVDIALKIKYH
ncbi:hypothetical protein JQC72_06685 [Polycladomyces sp. WAk]|uniref:Uncharacterized protein n=1 Tax=Polycladomyces zharkentensis TaxID=2807616 RepID=A0ABS2WI29_9BACL|nr:hypothetical protein [Polycladomyces sp. WAk]MBN2909208.1 hypothetical protein [Polycladomyces sp. WAk]